MPSYHSIIHSYIHTWSIVILSEGQTMPVIWNNLIVCKKVVRIVTNARRRDPVDHLFDDLMIMRFENISVLLISKFMYGVHNGQIPELFEGYFTRNCDVHDHYTRQSLFLHVPKVNGNLVKLASATGVYIYGMNFLIWE